jgi:hypothetical protein
MEFPKDILKEVYWSFSEGPIANTDAFAAAIGVYYKQFYKLKLNFKWKDIALNHPKISIQYLKYNNAEEDYDEPDFTLSADNGKYFTYKELFFKIHQMCTSKKAYSLEFDDRCYFEGLVFSGTIEDDVPLYFMITGS